MKKENNIQLYGREEALENICLVTSPYSSLPGQMVDIPFLHYILETNTTTYYRLYLELRLRFKGCAGYYTFDKNLINDLARTLHRSERTIKRYHKMLLGADIVVPHKANTFRIVGMRKLPITPRFASRKAAWLPTSVLRGSTKELEAFVISCDAKHFHESRHSYLTRSMPKVDRHGVRIKPSKVIRIKGRDEQWEQTRHSGIYSVRLQAHRTGASPSKICRLRKVADGKWLVRQKRWSSRFRFNTLEEARFYVENSHDRTVTMGRMKFVVSLGKWCQRETDYVESKVILKRRKVSYY